MDSAKSLEENLDDFSTICTELQNTGEEVKDQDQVVILLNSLPDSYKEVKAAIKYGRDVMTVDKILDAMRMRDLELKLEKKELETLFLRDNSKQQNKGRPAQKNQNSHQKGHNNQRENRNNGRPHGQGQSRRQDRSNLKCNYSYKNGHQKWDCYQLKKKANKQASRDNKSSANYHEGYESAEVLMITETCCTE